MKRIILFCISICLVNVSAAGIGRRDFPPDLQEILGEQADGLKANGGIYVAGRIKTSDGADINGAEDVMINFSADADAPLWVYEDGWFLMNKILPAAFAGTGKKLSLRAFEYAPKDAFIKVLKGDITYVELVMQKTPAENLASVAGTVTGDQNEPFKGAKVSIRFPGANFGIDSIGYAFPHKEATTDVNGQYSFDGLSAAQYTLMATAPGYAMQCVSFTPAGGEAATKDVKLYKNRKIVIDYVYQPEGNNKFTGEKLKTGTIEWRNGEGGVDFSDGRVEGYEPNSLRDIDMRQEQDELHFWISHFNGQQNGFYDKGAVDFESITEAPQAGYLTNVKPCVVGHTYIVKTYENNYAKFVVRSISRDE